MQSNQDSLRAKLAEFAATEERRHVPEECFRSGDIWKATIGDRDKIFVPAELRGEAIRGFHDDPMVGHPGRKKTTELVRRKYWWPSMYPDIAAYVRRCDACQRTKSLRTTWRKALVPHDMPEAPW